jgi:RNA polymerase sigma factor (sigma-70 family)
MSSRHPKPPIDFASVRRVVIEEPEPSLVEERQRLTIEHARMSRGYAEDVGVHSHDQATFRLINQRKELDKLPDADYVVPALDEWKHWTRMNDWDSRNRRLESLIGKFQRREANTGEIQLLFVICRPTLVKIGSSLRRYGGVDLDPAAGGTHRFEEAARVNHLDRDELDQVVRNAFLDALHACLREFPRRFFPWLQSVLVHRALDHIRRDLGERRHLLPCDEGIKDVIDQVLSDESGPAAASFRAPASPAFDQWLRTLDLPRIFELAAEFSTYARTRSACERAVERLPNRQRQVVQAHYYQEVTFADFAKRYGLQASSVRNSHDGALKNLNRDDELFEVLEAIGKVRDGARRLELQRTHEAA